MELLACLIELLGSCAEVFCEEVVWKFIGFIGLVVGNLLTLGRVDWEYDDWQSILTGAITCTGLAIVVMKCCLVAPGHAHSTSCVFAPGFSCA